MFHILSKIRSVTPLRTSQQGSFILIVLVVITMIGSYSLIGMKSTLYSTKLAGSFISHSLALQRAELALEYVEKGTHVNKEYKMKANNQPESVGRYPQFILHNNHVESAWYFLKKSDVWDDKRYVVHQFNNQSQKMSAYVIEELSLASQHSPLKLIRVTVKGWGYDSTASVILQSLISVNTKGENKRLSWQMIH